MTTFKHLHALPFSKCKRYKDDYKYRTQFPETEERRIRRFNNAVCGRMNVLTWEVAASSQQVSSSK